MNKKLVNPFFYFYIIIKSDFISLDNINKEKTYRQKIP